MADIEPTQDAESVVVPRWALEFILHRYTTGDTSNDGPSITVESVLRNCLETQHSDGSPHAD